MSTENALIMNTTVCFGKTGPVLVLGNVSFTLQDLYTAIDFNRTLEGNSRRQNWFKPSPSPSVLALQYILHLNFSSVIG